jgi:hypothetical protein
MTYSDLEDLSVSGLSEANSGNFFCNSIVDNPVFLDFLCLKFGFIPPLLLGLVDFLDSEKKKQNYFLKFPTAISYMPRDDFSNVLSTST